MKNYSICICMFICIGLFSQNQKGLTPLKNESSCTTEQTYAVVVGISDYQDEGIPDLRFADKDAEAFAGFLQSPAGGSLDEDHLKVLLNEEATMGEFAMSLDWLLEVASEKDKVIVYFSGHGDVEKKSFLQPGFLLCYDAPGKVYMSGGTFSLLMLKDVIATLSLGNKADVVIITDACRSGKLSGSAIGGAQATAANLSQQFANEIKILSCQPNEYSIEGEQWGGGRGAFSYHLVNGLYGLADRNTDKKVSLLELDRYLEDHVTPEVAPISQIPSVSGDKTSQLSMVDEEILKKIQADKSYQPAVFSKVESKGLEDDILAVVDTNIRQMHFAFKKSLEDEVFLEPQKGKPENDYADYYFQKLLEVPGLKPLHSTIRRNYAAALMESSQQYMNGLLDSDAAYCGRTVEIATVQLKKNIARLDRAILLLGIEHYMHKTLQSYRFLSKGILSSLGADVNEVSEKKGQESVNYCKKALEYQPGMPQAWLEIAWTYGVALAQYDSAYHFAKLAMDAVPDWIAAHIYLSEIEQMKGDFEKQKYWLDNAAEIDSSSFLVLREYGEYYHFQGNEELRLYYSEKAAGRGTPSYCSYIWLANIYMKKGEFLKAEKIYKKMTSVFTDKASRTNIKFLQSELYKITNRYFLVKELFEDLIMLDSTIGYPHALLGDFYMNSGQYEKGMLLYEKARLLEPENTNIGQVYGYSNTKNERWEIVQKVWRDLYEIDPDNIYFKSNMALAALYQNKYENALNLLKEVEKENPNSEHMLLTFGYYYTITNNLKSAEFYLKKGIESEGIRKPRMMALLGYVYMKTDQVEKGRSLIKEAYNLNKEINSFTREAYFFIGFGGLFRSANRHQDAIDIFEIMLEENPDDPLVHMELARSLAGFGKAKKAYFYLGNAVKKGYIDPVHLRNNTNFKNMWGTKKWVDFMESNFPPYQFSE